MISANMKNYDYVLYGEPDEYGQRTLIKDADGNPAVQGSIKMAVTVTNQSIQDNINYKGATYLGLTHNANVSDSFVIQYGEEQLKVLYVTPGGRYKQVFLVNI